jgi:hypothetical protein
VTCGRSPRERQDEDAFIDHSSGVALDVDAADLEADAGKWLAGA